MSSSRKQHSLIALLLVAAFGFSLLSPRLAFAEEEDVPVDAPPATAAQPSQPIPKREQRRTYHVPHTDRIDAGIFHVAFAGGGNFYIEPQVSKTTGAPTGDYFKDFGGQGGVYFDYDYSELTENVPFMLRGFVGYKYVLSSTHVFAFEGIARRMFRMSEDVSMGVGLGGSAALWYRTETATSSEQTLFLPSFILETGFEFNPFMVDLKWLVNRIGSDTTITGVEMYFGFRL